MFGVNLREIRKQKGFTQTTLAEALANMTGEKIEKGNIAKWENGTNPKISIIEALSIVLDTPEQFFFNSSDEKLNKIVSKFKPNINEALSNTKKIALIDGYIGAGSSGIISNVNIKDFLYIDNYSISKKYKDQVINAIEVIGDSMSPYVNDSDIVLYKPVEEKYLTNLHDGKYIIETVNGLQVKNLSFKSNGNIIISSENSAYPLEEIKKSESQEFLSIRGIVVGRILKN
ncbi:MAG: LexA family transcriptional regulator [Erysipelotrichia bacterium]|nr:LexA family transcriptional regulator [Erysipelotrichia bacterium]